MNKNKNTNGAIELFKQYNYASLCDGLVPVTLFTLEARGDWPIKGVLHKDHADVMSEWSANSTGLKERLKDNGIPEQFDNPPEKEGYHWEARGWGWGAELVNASCYHLDQKKWLHSSETNCTEEHDIFYVEYIKDVPVFEPEHEETLNNLPKKKGYKLEYRGKGWISGQRTEYAVYGGHGDIGMSNYIHNGEPIGQPDVHYWEYVKETVNMTMAEVNEHFGHEIHITD
jgi:hypothetical protein